MRHLSALTAVVLALALPSCPSVGLVHRAKVLDVRLDVRVTNFGVSPRKDQPQETQRPLTYLNVRVSIANRSDQHVWANGCRGLAFDESGAIVYTFSIAAGPPAGLELDGHREWAGLVGGVALVPHNLATRAVGATATCQAWDWDGYAPI
jgi:hypothetical protein